MPRTRSHSLPRTTPRLVTWIAGLCLAIGASGCESHEAWLKQTVAARLHLEGRFETPHRLAVLSTGREALLYRLDRIRAAQKSICIQTFIFANCKTSRLIIHELTQAARRGVDVRILADSMFSERSAIHCARAAAAHPRIRFRAFNPVTKKLEAGVVKSLWTMATEFGRINRRMHNKLMVIDERWGICGGRNFEDMYFDEGLELVYRDRDAVVEGPVVADMVQSFEEYWDHESSIPIEELTDVKTAITNLPPDERSWPFSLADLEIVEIAARMEELLRSGEPRLTWHDVSSIAFWADRVGKPDVDDHPGGVVTRLIGAIGSARHRLLLQTPYLVFTDATIEFFGMLHDEVETTVHTNSLASTDNWTSYAHSIRQRFEMIKTLGLDVRELKPYPRDLAAIVTDYTGLRKRALGKTDPRPIGQEGDPILSLHAKSMVVDDELALIGSYNLDPRSETINSEVILAIWDRDVAALLAAQIELDCRPQNSWVVAPKKRPFGMASVLGLLELVNAQVKTATTFDVWPIRSCSVFDIKPGADPVSRFDERFYDNYVDVGQFPGVSSTKDKILVRLTRSLTGVFRSQMQ